MRVGSAVAPVHPRRGPRLQRGHRAAPRHAHHEIRDDGIVAQPFHHHADARELAAIRTGDGGGEVRCDRRQVAVEIHLAAKVVQHVPDPRLAVEGVAGLPHRMTIAPEVEHDHPVVGHRANERARLRLLPELGLIIEEPPLQHPDRRRIGGVHGVVNGASHAGEEGGII